MEKVLESFGVIDGYDIISIGKRKIKKDELFEEIEKCDSKIREKIQKSIDKSSGKNFAIIKKGKIKGVYLFEIERKEDEKILNLIESVYTDEVATETREKYDAFLLDIAKEHVSMNEYTKVTLGNKVVQVNPKTNRNLAIVSGFIIGFALGWIIFDNIVLGILYGLIFSPVFGGLEVIVTNKRGRKKKKDKNK